MADAVKRPYTCPECGGNTYFAENFDRIRDRSMKG